MEINGCSWLQELGAESIGSEEHPLPLQIKARGNWTRTAFSKKPFKIKLDKKQNLLGLSKSKHFALLPHADDWTGYLRNFTGFNLGKRIGLPWTPSQQPVEIVINGDYRGLYFMTESIRVEEDRVNITNLKDFESDPCLISGGYIVEIDNYQEDNQIRIPEKSFVQGRNNQDIWISWEAPEQYSELQKRFITDQFTTINELVGNNSDDVWAYVDLDDAVRYYLVVEIISHKEAYCGSTYLFRDYGEEQKWHFSPLWDLGQAFMSGTSNFLYEIEAPGYRYCWIPSLRCNDKFNEKLYNTWIWFMTNHFDGLIEDIDNYVLNISEAAKFDYIRWKDELMPDCNNSRKVEDNSNMYSKRDFVINTLIEKINWLKTELGDYSELFDVSEPERDETPAAPLPEYANLSYVENVDVNQEDILYDLQGIRIIKPLKGRMYIRKVGSVIQKITY